MDLKNKLPNTRLVLNWSRSAILYKPDLRSCIIIMWLRLWLKIWCGSAPAPPYRFVAPFLLIYEWTCCKLDWVKLKSCLGLWLFKNLSVLNIKFKVRAFVLQLSKMMRPRLGITVLRYDIGISWSILTKLSE
jgi:hypothetical protein